MVLSKTSEIDRDEPEKGVFVSKGILIETRARIELDTWLSGIHGALWNAQHGSADPLQVFYILHRFLVTDFERFDIFKVGRCSNSHHL